MEKEIEEKQSMERRGKRTVKEFRNIEERKFRLGRLQFKIG